MIICKRPVHQDDHLHLPLVVVCHWSLFDICRCLLLVSICCLSFVVVYRLSLFVVVCLLSFFVWYTQTTKILQKGGGSSQVITILHGREGSLGTPDLYYVINGHPLTSFHARPLCHCKEWNKTVCSKICENISRSVQRLAVDLWREPLKEAVIYVLAEFVR